MGVVQQAERIQVRSVTGVIVSSLKRAPFRRRGTDGRPLASCVRGLGVAIEKCCELRFRKSADLGGFDFAVFEQHECRNAANSVLRRGLLIGVDVELANFDVVRVFVGDIAKLSQRE